MKVSFWPHDCRIDIFAANPLSLNPEVPFHCGNISIVRNKIRFFLSSNGSKMIIIINARIRHCFLFQI